MHFQRKLHAQVLCILCGEFITLDELHEHLFHMHNKLHILLSEQGLYYFFIGSSVFVLMFISIKARSLQYSKLTKKNQNPIFFSWGLGALIKTDFYPVPSLHWMLGPTKHDAGTFYQLILYSSSLNPYKHVFHAFVYLLEAHIVIQHIALLPSWKSFCSPAFAFDVGWCMSLLGSFFTLCIKLVSVMCTEGSGCVQWPCVYAPTQEQPVLQSWHLCSVPSCYL